MEIKPGPKAPHVQVSDYLRSLIEDGTYGPGDKIPSQTDLEAETGLSRNTIKKALDTLKSEGILVTSPGRGLYVADDQETPAE